MDTASLATTSLTILGFKVQGGPDTLWQLADKRVAAAAWFDATALNSVVKATGTATSDGNGIDVTARKVQTGEDDD